MRKTLEGHSDLVWDANVSHNGELIVSGSDDRSVILWDANNGEELRKFKGHTEGVRGCCFSRDSRFIVSASQDKSLRVWDTNTGQLIQELSGHNNFVKCCDMSCDDVILSGSLDNSLKTWNLDGTCLRTFQGHSEFVWSCQFSNDGKFFASGSADKTVRIWDKNKSDAIKVLSEHSETVTFRNRCFTSARL